MCFLSACDKNDSQAFSGGIQTHDILFTCANIWTFSTTEIQIIQNQIVGLPVAILVVELVKISAQVNRRLWVQERQYSFFLSQAHEKPWAIHTAD